MLHTHASINVWWTNVSPILAYKDEPSIRGQLLAVAVLYKVVSLNEDAKLSSWLPLDDMCFAGVRDATINVSHVVSGKGVFNRWLKAVLENPSDDFIPGVAARNVCVRPETLAGADGAFAAFLGDAVVIVTIACAWYMSSVTKAKWKDQAERSSVLLKQFTQKASKGKKSKKKKKGVNDTKRQDIADLLGTLRVLFELPKRTGKAPLNNIQDGALVVDKWNVESVLGPEIHRACN